MTNEEAKQEAIKLRDSFIQCIGNSFFAKECAIIAQLKRVVNYSNEQSWKEQLLILEELKKL